VDDLSFRVDSGEALALWGPNGAGKTTAIRCVLGLIRGRGRITIAGFDARRQGKAARRSLGYVPQELCLHDDFTALDALHFYARLKRAGSDRPARVLREVGLEDHGRKRVRELSGGMKQRLALAIALLADPPLLVLDELTSNLDAEARSGFTALLRDVKRQGKTILFTSHRLDEIEQLADRVLVMERGRARFECVPEALAGRLGLRSVLKVFVDAARIPDAVEALRRRGFIAAPNGIGVHVEIPSRRKASPILALEAAAIDVLDFEFLADGHLSPERKGMLQ
jgi:ABC-type multidrug transport system ATPase subunit